MKLTVLQKDLAENLNNANRFVNPRAQLPIFSNIILKTLKNKLLIMSTNLETSYAATVGAKVEKEGEIALPARVITDLILNLKSEAISLSVAKEKLSIKSGDFSATVTGMNTADFPKIPLDVGKGAFVVNQEKLTKAISQVIFSTSTDETRPILTGVLFLLNGKKMTLVATDGFRLSQKHIKLGTDVGEAKVIVPKSILGEVVKIFSSEKEVSMFVDNKENRVVFAAGNITLSSGVLEGEFPKFENIIPKETNVTVQLDKEELRRAVRLASVFARESSNTINFKVEKKGLTVEAKSPKSGGQESLVDSKVDGGELNISFNYRFVEEFLGAASGSELEIGLSDVSSPGVFKDRKDPGFLHLVMPVKQS